MTFRRTLRYGFVSLVPILVGSSPVAADDAAPPGPVVAGPVTRVATE